MWKLLLPLLLFSLLVPSHAAGRDKKVFAHYMLCCPTYNGSVSGFVAEIQEAQKYGIDGFALNAGQYLGTNYRESAIAIYEAARVLNSGFVLFFSSDQIGDPASVIAMVADFYNHTNQFKYQNKSVLSTYSGLASFQFWLDSVFIPLRNDGKEVFFVPNFGDAFNYRDSLDAMMWNYDACGWDFVLDGWFDFAAAQLSDYSTWSGTGVSNEPLPIKGWTNTQVMRQKGKLAMGGVNPLYWGAKQPGRRYYEYEGGKSMALQWEMLINVNPEWVEIVTWNDLDEAGYICPLKSGTINPWVFDLGAYQRGGTPNVTEVYYPTKEGTISLMSYFIQWFKTGVEPLPNKDSIYWFYRTHPENVWPKTDSREGVFARNGPVADKIYIYSILSQPATIVVTSGGKQASIDVPAGRFHSATNFSVGKQSFQVVRGGKTIMQGDGNREIIDNPVFFNFHYATGVLQADVAAQGPTVPQSLTVTKEGIDSVALAWTASQGATKYTIKISKSNLGPFTVAGNTTATQFTVTGLETNMTVYIVVSATNAQGVESINSAPLYALPNNLPDMIAIDIELDPAIPINQVPKVYTIIKNIGNGNSSYYGTGAIVNIDGGYPSAQNDFPTGFIPPGGTARVLADHYHMSQAEFWNFTASFHVIKAVAYTSTPERNITNNIFVKRFNLAVDVAASSLFLTYVNASVVTLSANITNVGFAAGPQNTTVCFYLNGQILLNLTIDVPLPNVTVPVKFNVPLVVGGKYKVSVNNDPYPKFLENLYVNNVAECVHDGKNCSMQNFPTPPPTNPPTNAPTNKPSTPTNSPSNNNNATSLHAISSLLLMLLVVVVFF